MKDTTITPRLRRYTVKFIVPFVIILVAVLVVVYMMNSETSARRAKPAHVARLVEVVEASPSNSGITIEAWGTVVAARRITLQSQVAGEIQHTADGFEPGAHIARGELLLQIDPENYRLAVRQRRADLTKAQADLALEEGKRVLAEQEFALLSKETDPSPAQRRLMLREPQRETARAAVASAEAALAAAELDLARTGVKAPFNALVIERQVNTGARVSAGSNLADLVDTDSYWVELAVPAASLRWLEIPSDAEPGSTVRLYQEQVWGKARYREGRVVRVRGDLDKKGRMARLLVAVDDPLALTDNAIDTGQPPLLLGAFVRAEIAGRQLQDGLALERSWLRDDNTLWVMDSDDKLAIRHPELIYSGDRQVYVRDGIEPGDRIITSELAVAVEGMPLRIAKNPEGRTP